MPLLRQRSGQSTPPELRLKVWPFAAPQRPEFHKSRAADGNEVSRRTGSGRPSKG